MLAGGRVDLLFSEMLLPGAMNGLQLAIEAKRLRPGLKVLLTSCHTSEVTGRAPAPFPMLTKPYNQELLGARRRIVLRG